MERYGDPTFYQVEGAGAQSLLTLCSDYVESCCSYVKVDTAAP